MRKLRSQNAAQAAASLLALLLSMGCSATAGSSLGHRGSGGAGSINPGAGGADGLGGAGTGINLDGGLISPGGSGGVGTGDACVTNMAEPTLTREPVDIILALDNSGSMADELQAVEDNINQNFANILNTSGVDYRIILISRHRKQIRTASAEASTSICVSAPLSGVPACPTPANAITVPAPVFGERFFQYNLKIESTNSLDPAPAVANDTGGILAGYSAPDVRDNPLLAASGWSTWLRPGAKKVFLEVTDDNAVSTADSFVQGLITRAPQFFGTDVLHPTFVFHSIIGIKEKAVPTAAYVPTDPVEMGKCTGNADGVSNAGLTYQDLSIRTGGLRFPICQFTGYDAVFQRIADDVVTHRGIGCDFPVPTPPDGRALDPSRVAVNYTKGDGSGTVQFGQARTQADCQANAFYSHDSIISLCPEACSAINADPGSSVSVLFTCQSTYLPPR